MTDLQDTIKNSASKTVETFANHSSDLADRGVIDKPIEGMNELHNLTDILMEEIANMTVDIDVKARVMWPHGVDSTKQMKARHLLAERASKMLEKASDDILKRVWDQIVVHLADTTSELQDAVDDKIREMNDE
jgi:hypothetical protein